MADCEEVVGVRLVIALPNGNVTHRWFAPVEPPEEVDDADD